MVVVQHTTLDVAGSRSVDSTGRLAFFMPAAPLAVGTTHRIWVIMEVQDVAGNLLAFTSTTLFTTGFEVDTTTTTVLAVDPTMETPASRRTPRLRFR